MNCYRVILVGSVVALAGVAHANLIVNGDFELGNTGFSSDLAYNPTNYTPAAVYAVDTDPHLHHGSWLSYGDHTTGTGKMLIVNGATTSALSRFWYQSLTLVSGQQYSFTGFIRSQFSATERVYVTVDGTSLGTLHSMNNTGWTMFTQTFTYSGSGTAILGIHTPSNASTGNDITVDDLRLEAVPEPASLTAIAVGLVALVRRRRN